MPRLLALLDDLDFGDEPEVFCGNAELRQRRAGGGVHDPDYFCEAVGSTFFTRYDFVSADEAKGGKRKKGKRGDDSDSDGEAYVGKKEKGGTPKTNAFLKLSEHIKGVNLYELFNITEGASQEEVKKAYRALALTAHPDKQVDKSEAEMKVIQDKFVQVQEGYEILSDASTRQQYDSSLDFDDSLPRFKADGDEDFYETFRECFQRNARFSVKRPVPDLGDADTKTEDWKKFYNFWFAFQSWRDPVVMAQNEEEDIHDLNDSECREERRWMMRENDRIARKYKQAERERICELVRMAEKFDPRIQAEKDSKKAQREADNAKRAEAAMAVQRAKEEAEQQKREEEEKIKAVEEQKRKEEKAVRDEAKKGVKMCRQRLRALHPQVRSFVQMDQLNEVCLRFEEADLKRLGDEAQKALKKSPEKAAAVLHKAIESIGLKPVTSVEEEEDSTASGQSSNEKEVVPKVETPEQRAKREKEEKDLATEKQIRDAEKAEQKKIRDELRRKEQAAADALKRQQEKKEAEKKKKAEEKKKKDEDAAVEKKAQQREEAQVKAQEQAVADRQKAMEKKMEQEMERIVQLFITDRQERLTKLDQATDAELSAALMQGAQDDPALAGAIALLTSDFVSEVSAEEVLDRGMGLVHKLSPIWVIGLLLDAEIKLPNAVRNRAKKARQRLQNLVQAFLAQGAPSGADAGAATEWQRGIVDGSIEVPVFNLMMKEDEEEAAKAALPEKEEAGKAKKKKAGKPKGGEDEDLDKLLASIEAPGKAPTSPEGKKGGKKKK